jgi:hypothetical protein
MEDCAIKGKVDKRQNLRVRERIYIDDLKQIKT